MDWKQKLTSRKLWMAVIGLVTGVMLYLGKSEAEATQIGALILSAASIVSYIIGEGLVDAAGASGDVYVEAETKPPAEEETFDSGAQ